MIHKILLIEDELSVNRRAIEKLVMAGYEVIKAIGPSAAERQLRRNPDLDLIILDCIMPPEVYSDTDTQQGTLTGYVIYQKLLKNLQVPVVLWTVLGQAFDAGPGGIEWGSNVVLKVRKRMENDELLNLVERAAAAHSAAY
jgi:CheY-like chemotaxis protein